MHSKKKRIMWQLFRRSAPLFVALTIVLGSIGATFASVPLEINLQYTKGLSKVATLSVAAQETFAKAAPVCTKWTVESSQNPQVPKNACFGNEACCSFIGLPVEEVQWDTPLYLYLGMLGATDRNTVSAQLIFADYSVDPLNPYADIRYSNVESAEIFLLDADAQMGNVVLIQQDPTAVSGVYYEMTDPLTNAQITLDAQVPRQGDIVLDFPVTWTQTLSLTNLGEDTDAVINLWNYLPQLGQTFLEDALSVEVYAAGLLVSQTPAIITPLKKGETKSFEIQYHTPPVEMKKVCVQQRLSDLLPLDASIISSDLDLTLPLKEICTVKIFHDSKMKYTNVKVPITGIPVEEVTSVFYVEGKEYLQISGSEITLSSIQ